MPYPLFITVTTGTKIRTHFDSIIFAALAILASNLYPLRALNSQ